MIYPTPWRLTTNGDDWIAVRNTGRYQRERRRLNMKTTGAKRRAQALVDRLNDGAGHTGERAPVCWRVRPWCDRFLELISGERAARTVASYRETVPKLVEGFGADANIETITRAQADDWRAAMLKAGLSQGTVSKHVRQARAIFQRAVDRGELTENPFAGVASPIVAAERKSFTTAEVQRLIEAAPDAMWRAAIATAAFAGPRLGELLRITWDDVDLGAGKIHIIDTKRGRHGKVTHRFPAIAPELEPYLVEASETRESRRLLPMAANTAQKHMQGIRERAAVPEGVKPFQGLRAHAEAYWSSRVPWPTVLAWIGHSAKVAQAHYYEVPEDHYRVGTDSTRGAAEAKKAQSVKP